MNMDADAIGANILTRINNVAQPYLLKQPLCNCGRLHTAGDVPMSAIAGIVADVTIDAFTGLWVSERLADARVREWLQTMLLAYDTDSAVSA